MIQVCATKGESRNRTKIEQECQKSKDSLSKKFERRPRLFVKLSFREKCDSKLSGLHSFDNMTIFH